MTSIDKTVRTQRPMNWRDSIRRWALGIGAIPLLFAAGCALEGKADPQQREYESINDLKTAVEDAGYDCPAWGAVDENSDLSGAIWTLVCSNDDVLNWYSGAYARKVEEGIEVCSDVIQLNGRNWAFETRQAPELHDALGGYLCDG